jgi:hypothetical protein
MKRIFIAVLLALGQLQHTIERAHRRIRKQPHLLQEFLAASKLYARKMFAKAEAIVNNARGLLSF